MSPKSLVENRIREIRRNTRRKYSAEEKVRIVIEGLRGEDSIAALLTCPPKVVPMYKLG